MRSEWHIGHSNEAEQQDGEEDDKVEGVFSRTVECVWEKTQSLWFIDVVKYLDSDEDSVEGDDVGVSAQDLLGEVEVGEINLAACLV